MSWSWIQNLIVYFLRLNSSARWEKRCFGSAGNSTNEASFTIKWNGTDIDLLKSIHDASYEITLDGINYIYNDTSDPDNILASFHDSDNTNHTLVLRTNNPVSYALFHKALINSMANSKIIDDNNDMNDVIDSTRNFMHISNTVRDPPRTTFVRSAVTVYGLVSTYTASFSATIDNIATSFSALSSYNHSNALLCIATHLSQESPHIPVPANTQNMTFSLKVRDMNIAVFDDETVTTSSSSSVSRGIIAAIVLGSVLLVVLACNLIYWIFVVRPRGRLRKNFPSKPYHSLSRTHLSDPERSLPQGEEDTNLTSLSTNKGHRFELGPPQRAFTFSPKTKLRGSNSDRGDTTRSRSLHFSTDTHTLESATFGFPPESERLAPGWTNPITRTSLDFTGKWFMRVESYRVALPALRVEEVGAEDEDEDADIKNLTSRQDETLAAILSLRPRTSGVLPGLPLSAVCSIAGTDGAAMVNEDREPPLRLLDVTATSPFEVDVEAIFGQLGGNQDSRRTSGSGSSSWLCVGDRSHLGTHSDARKRSIHEDALETTTPKSVSIATLQSAGSEPFPPAWSINSFLDFTSSHSSVCR